jgi:hypothetical protein
VAFGLHDFLKVNQTRPVQVRATADQQKNTNLLRLLRTGSAPGGQVVRVKNVQDLLAKVVASVIHRLNHPRHFLRDEAAFTLLLRSIAAERPQENAAR